MNLDAIAKEASDIKDTGKEISKTTINFDARIEVTESKFSDEKNASKYDSEMKKDNSESKKEYNPDDRVEIKKEESLAEIVKDYINEIKDYSDCADTIAEEPFKASDLEKTSPEQVQKLREEFNNKKNELIAKWEEENGQEWPTYKEDVYITNKDGERIKIREAGQRYDAHHIQPLSLGGKNEATNITPIRADVHIDHRGVHSKEGAFGKLEEKVGGN